MDQIYNLSRDIMKDLVGKEMSLVVGGWRREENGR